MTKPRTFEKPTGFRDLPPPLAAKKRLIEERVQTTFIHWGYQEVFTPTLEFYDTVGSASAISERKMFKCIDREGYTLVLRPDHTTPIARMVASMFQHHLKPLRLFYHGSVFRSQDQEAGRSAELFQSGVELIGESSPEADAEVIALAIESLLACKMESFQVTIGHVGLLDKWIGERLDDLELSFQLKDSLSKRDVVAFRQQVEQLEITEEKKEQLFFLLRLQPNRSYLRQLKELTQDDSVLEAIQHVDEVWSHLEDYGFGSYLSFDPSLIGSIGYYTGIYFEGYSLGQGFPVLSGGRYDRLFDQFQTSLPATGFALKVDRLMESSPITLEPVSKLTLMYRRSAKKEAIAQARLLRGQGNIVVLVPVNDEEEINQHDQSAESIWIVKEGDW